jgi:hypothetical protein
VGNIVRNVRDTRNGCRQIARPQQQWNTDPADKKAWERPEKMEGPIVCFASKRVMQHPDLVRKKKHDETAKRQFYL